LRFSPADAPCDDVAVAVAAAAAAAFDETDVARAYEAEAAAAAAAVVVEAGVDRAAADGLALLPPLLALGPPSLLNVNV
jgi:hypothetical protein